MTARQARQRTPRAGARLERAALAAPASAASTRAGEKVLSIDGGPVRSVKGHRQLDFEVVIGRVTGAYGQERIFSSAPAEARQATEKVAAPERSRGGTETLIPLTTPPIAGRDTLTPPRTNSKSNRALGV